MPSHFQSKGSNAYSLVNGCTDKRKPFLRDGPLLGGMFEENNLLQFKTGNLNDEHKIWEHATN